MNEYRTISVEKKEDVIHLTLDREHRMNALNREMVEELESGLEEIAAENPNCIVISGAGSNFSAGADISGFRAKVQYLSDVSRRGKEVFNSIEKSPIPSVAAIRGNCLGGGLELAMACDFRVASEDSKLGQPEINLGIIPGWGGTQKLPRLVGLSRAKEMIMLGERIPAEEAKGIGLVNKVFSADEFEGEVNKFATKIAEGPPIALKYAKYSLHYGSQAPRDIGEEIETSLFASIATTEDMAEGIEAFMEKREPEFKGK